MEEGRITIAGMVAQMINSGQFSEEEEAEIQRLIEEKHKKGEDSHRGRCLAEAVKAEMMKKVDPKDIKMTDMYQTVLRKCFMETKAGNMDSLQLSEKAVRDFETEVRESFGLGENEKLLFMGMLQIGLNKLSGEGILNFAPDKNMFKRFADSRNGVSYIDNPYSSEETEKIMKWAKAHPADVRGLAISLWLTGGISLTEIVNLTKKDCWSGVRAEGSIMKFDKNLFKVTARSQIVWGSLRLHPKNVEQVFVVPKEDKSGWKKLTELGLQRKLCYICQDIGIDYKSIHRSEAIKIKRIGYGN